jgi:glycerate 2-kinase
VPVGAHAGVQRLPIVPEAGVLPTEESEHGASVPYGMTTRTAPQLVLLQAFEAAVAAAHPGIALRAHLPPPPRGRLLVVGAGKGAAVMAAEVERAYPPGLATVEGVVVTGRGQGAAAGRVAVLEAGHPLPDEDGQAATEAMLALVDGAGQDDHVLALVSGGGSALLGAPAGLSLHGLREVVAALLRSGADVREINVVRRRLGRAAGGRLAWRARPAPLTALVVSDVVGDDPADIASGPTVPDPTDDATALAVLDRYAIDAPEARARLSAGAEAPAPPAGDPDWGPVTTRIVASSRLALDAAAAALRAAGWPTTVLADDVTGEAREAGAWHAAVARSVLTGRGVTRAPCAFVSGGETTVTVRGEGRGGRNSEFALGLALALPDGVRLWALAADSDGIDGVGGHAGAFVDPHLWRAVTRAAARAALERNDSLSVFEAAGSVLTTGPTGTNVNDLRLLLIGRPDAEPSAEPSAEPDAEPDAEPGAEPDAEASR